MSDGPRIPYAASPAAFMFNTLVRLSHVQTTTPKLLRYQRPDGKFAMCIGDHPPPPKPVLAEVHPERPISIIDGTTGERLASLSVDEAHAFADQLRATLPDATVRDLARLEDEDLTREGPH